MASAESSRRIQDAGEKIGGARKDYFSRELSIEDLGSMSAEEALDDVTKDNIWRAPDYAAMVENGAEPMAAALIKIIRDRLPAKPDMNIIQLGTSKRRDPEKLLSDYVTMMGMVRDAAAACRTADDARKISDTLLEQVDWAANWRNDETRHLLMSVKKAKTGVRYASSGSKDPLYIQSKDMEKAAALVAAGFPTEAIPVWKKGVAYKTFGGVGVLVRNRIILKDGFKDEAEAWSWLEADYGKRRNAAKDAKKTKLVSPKRPTLEKLERIGFDDRRGGRDVQPDEFISTFGFRAVEFGNWLPDSERQEVLNYAYDSLTDLAEVIGIEPSQVGLEGNLAIAFGARGEGTAAAHYEPGRRVINMTRTSSPGTVAHEWGHAIDHWCGYTNRSDDKTASVPSGSGWHVRMENVAAGLKNLSQPEGAAWQKVIQAIHTRPKTREEAISEYQAEIDGLLHKIADYKAQAEAHIAKLPPERRDGKWLRSVGKWIAFQSDMKIPALEKQVARLKATPDSDTFGATTTNYRKEAGKLSGKSGDYWQRPTELFARALECFVYDAMLDRGCRSDYLVYGVDDGLFADPETYKGDPYPAGEERTAIKAAIQNLLHEIRPRLTAEVVSGLNP